MITYLILNHSRMDKLIEEEEIKIEYNESFEVDPLCDENLSSESNLRYGVNYNLEENNEFQPIPEETNCLHGDKTSDSHKYNTNDSTRSVVTWYDSIDNSGQFLCKFCDLKYSTLQTLRFHVKSKHPEKVNHIKENLIRYKRNSKLKCHICKQQFKEILALTSHLDSNHSIEHIKTSCLYCDATFTTENEMSEHLLIQHNKIFHKSTYICTVCGYRTSTKSHYNQHRSTHEGDKTKKCKYCDYVTNYLPNLKIHERIHTNDKVYVCDFMNCQYRCSAKSALRSHQLKHNPEDNILYCDKCSYKTIYRQCLKRHNDCHKRNSIRLKLH